MADCGPDTRFQPVLDDPLANRAKTKRIVLLTGKLYYELLKQRETQKLVDEVSFIRLEELSPFPFTALREILEQYTNAPRKEALEVVWVQEEPRNQGAWPHVKERIETVVGGIHGKEEVKWMGYRGRKESAVPAPGIGKIYAEQQKAVVESVFAGL